MSTYPTVFQGGKVRGFREDDVADIDFERLQLDVGDGLKPTEIAGNRNSYRQSDGDGTLVVRRIVRGDGVNTVHADSSTLAGTMNILGMVVLTDTTDVRVAVTGSIVDGFVGLTKHAKYYLGTNGQISLVPGVIPVEIGVAVSDTELLLQICCCVCVGQISLEKCFSSAFFDCEEGAHYCLYGTGAGECIPALEFKPGVTNYWYCGFPTPDDMDVTQDSYIELRMAAPTVHPSVLTSWQVTYRSVLAAQQLFTGGVLTTLPVATVAPGAQHIAVTLVMTIPGGSLVAAAMNRQVISRLGAVDTFLGSMNLIAATFKYVCR